MKKVVTKTRKEIYKELKKVHAEFDLHLGLGKEKNMALSSCSRCNDFWGQLRSLEWVLGIGDWE